MPLNVDLLNRTLAYIEAHPDKWEQDMWAMRTACGTTYCFAGTAVMLAGGKPLFEDDEDDASDGWAHHVLVGSLPQVTGPQDSDRTLYSKVARDLLGLTGGQASELFDERNDLHHLRYLVAKFTSEADAGQKAAL